MVKYFDCAASFMVEATCSSREKHSEEIAYISGPSSL